MHGDLPVLLICDNLDAHCCEDVLKIFSSANVFVFFVVKGCTDSLQPIDAGIGRCMRVYVGHALDDWLSVDDNLDLWEKGMVARDRRVLMTHLLDESMRQILSASRERMRIGCFERTGCLLRLLPHDDDSLVRPQGLPEYQIPIGNHHGVEALPPPAETVPNKSIEEELEDSIDDINKYVTARDPRRTVPKIQD